MIDFLNYILETNTVKFCNNKPFWTKKGTLIPYKINTNLLFGSTNDAIELSDFITLSYEQTNKLSIPRNIFIKVLKQYQTNKKYQNFINLCIDKINQLIGESRIDYISGVEKNDWFFSLIIAYLLKKPHISIFKNKSAIVTNSSFTNTLIINNLEGARILNISSVLNNINKFSKLLIPTLNNLNSQLYWNFSIIDDLRNSYIQLNDFNIENIYLTSILDIIKTAYDKKYINNATYKLSNNFYNNPNDTMRNFLINHPTFIKKSLSSSNSKAAKLCIEKHIYFNI